MNRIIGSVLVLVSSLYLPWQCTAVLAIVAGMWDPIVPLAAGILIDTLYAVPTAHVYPLASLAGAAATALLFLVRRQLRSVD